MAILLFYTYGATVNSNVLLSASQYNAAATGGPTPALLTGVKSVLVGRIHSTSTMRFDSTFGHHILKLESSNETHQVPQELFEKLSVHQPDLWTSRESSRS